MEVKALQQMLSQFRQSRKSSEKQIGEISVEASSAAHGHGEDERSKTIDRSAHRPDVFKSKDQEMLQELMLAAVNEATRRVDEELSKQVKRIYGRFAWLTGMKIPRHVLS